VELGVGGRVRVGVGSISSSQPHLSQPAVVWDERRH
jgi:hypothetical protein